VFTNNIVGQIENCCSRTDTQTVPCRGRRRRKEWKDKTLTDL